MLFSNQLNYNIISDYFLAFLKSNQDISIFSRSVLLQNIQPDIQQVNLVKLSHKI